MTVSASASDLIKSLASVLSKAESWYSLFPGNNTAEKQAAALAAIYYPDADPEDDLPLAVLQLDNRQATISLIMSPEDQDVAKVQDIGDGLSYELQSRFRLDMTGVLIPEEPTASDVLEATDWQTAGGNPAHTINLTCTIGVSV